MENPWRAQHAAAEAVYQDNDHAMAAAIVANEYRDAPGAVPCECGGMAHYKATIGAMKCPACGELYDSQGDRI